MNKYKISKQCRLCGHNKLEKILELPKTVPGEQLKLKRKNQDPSIIPIDYYFCMKCSHVQLIHVPSINKLWGKKYTFKPSDNPKLIKHFTNSAKFFCNNFHSNINFAFEIGSNDGLFLKKIREITGCQVLGIDPSDEPVKIAINNKIPTIKNFFSYNFSKKIRKKYGCPDLIIANNVFAHIDDMQSIVKGISHLLKNKGYFIFEASYLLDVVKKYLIGTIIHEHLSVHSLYSLRPFLLKFNLHLIGLKHASKIQGGAIIGVAIKSKKHIPSLIVDNYIKKEKLNKLTSLDGMQNFNRRFKIKINKFIKLINKKLKKNKLIGFGAARSAPLIIDILELRDKMSFIIDDNPRKINKFLSIGNIPINSFASKKNKLQNSVILILGWTQTERIITFLESKKIKCTAITIFPKFKIISI